MEGWAQENCLFMSTATNQAVERVVLGRSRGGGQQGRVAIQAVLFRERMGSRMIWWFVHSFILTISIAPLRVHYYSEALPTARILRQSFMPKRYRQLRVKDLPKVSMWRPKRYLDPWPFGRKATNLPTSHNAPQFLKVCRGHIQWPLQGEVSVSEWLNDFLHLSFICRTCARMVILFGPLDIVTVPHHRLEQIIEAVKAKKVWSAIADYPVERYSMNVWLQFQ